MVFSVKRYRKIPFSASLKKDEKKEKIKFLKILHIEYGESMCYNDAVKRRK